MLDLVLGNPIFISELKADSAEPNKTSADLLTSGISDQEAAAAQKGQADKPAIDDLKDVEKSLEGTSESPSNEPSHQCKYTDIELEILQSLDKRRQELEDRDSDISLKESSLNVIDKNIKDKIAELEDLQKQLKGIMTQYEAKEDEKILRLVKVYENMKPQEASKIFEQLPMPILLEVANKMKEPKLAAILAKMDSKKAEELTVELANWRRVKTSG
ncbi:MAG: MotE family protein [Rickettsiales bacterium]